MNGLAKKLGINNSHFGTANGWPDNGVTYVTARDLGTIARATIEHHPKLYKEFYSLPNFTWGKTMGSGKDITQENRNPILGHVPGADGLKTGHTDEAGYGFTGSAEQNGRRLIEVIAGMDSWNQRVQESTRLITWGFGAWNDKPLFKAGDKVGAAKVQLGSSSDVPLVAPRDLAVSVPAGLSLSNKPVTMMIRYDGPLIAPIAKGQEVAQLVITTGDTSPQIVPLVAAEDVGRAGFFGRIWLGLKQLVGLA
jgi:D-alanyl-D-alanine carboxypeptidase (penicillin-binding protein 5/6)